MNAETSGYVVARSPDLKRQKDKKTKRLKRQKDKKNKNAKNTSGYVGAGSPDLDLAIAVEMSQVGPSHR